MYCQSFSCDCRVSNIVYCYNITFVNCMTRGKNKNKTFEWKVPVTSKLRVIGKLFIKKNYIEQRMPLITHIVLFRHIRNNTLQFCEYFMKILFVMCICARRI